jgi:hypothetical protein
MFFTQVKRIRGKACGGNGGNGMKPGWYDVPNEIYHHSEEYRYCMTSSGLKQIEKSPLHWHTMRTMPRVGPTAAMAFGSAFHSYMLEPHKIERELLTGKTQVTIDDNEMISVNAAAKKSLEGMRESLMACELSAIIMNHPKIIIEQAGIFQDPIRPNVYGTIKPDIRIPELGMIVDLKTTTDASETGFPRSVRRFKYDWQAWWYLRGANAISHELYDKFVIIAIEKTPPYGVMLYELTETMYWAEIRVMPLIEKFSLCLDMDRWPGYKNYEVIMI